MLASPSLVVFAPSPLLTIAVEGTGAEEHEIHLHAGGQGFWVARMAALLGARVSLCCALGGEPGAVLRALIARENVHLLAAVSSEPNGVYIHTRLGGERREISRTQSRRLSRHQTDELYGITLSAALDADIVLLTGVDPPTLIDPDIYRRLAGDLRSNEIQVIADLTDGPLRSALQGGVDLLKLSHQEMLAEGLAGEDRLDELVGAMARLHDAGAGSVLISRGEQPALALRGTGPEYLKLTGPRVQTLEARGTGDSMFAALAVGLANDRDLNRALRLAMAAGCLNATRHGLGTGTREQIELLSRHIDISEISPPER